MDITGICDICAKAGACFTCVLCGKRICKDCITLGGACKTCAGGKSIQADSSRVNNILRDKGLGL